eukprot:scaffold7.g3441.t1
MRRNAISTLLRGLQAARSSAAPPAWARAFASDESLLKTPLYDYHVVNGGKMVEFAGWSMPIQYKDSIMESTLWCREHSSLFDVSHMCGLTLKGKDAIPFLEGLVVGDVRGIADGSGSLSVFTNEMGGIIDDTVVTKVSPEEIYLVVNAGCREKDLAHIGKHLDAFKAKGGDVNIAVHNDRALLALQGPEAAAVLQARACDARMPPVPPHGRTASMRRCSLKPCDAPKVSGVDFSDLYFSNFRRSDLAGVPAWVTRTGYTGEDGFEISLPAELAVQFTEKLMADGRVRLCGLAPRDSLRLEAGLCLYGNDLNEGITPVEAGLTWTIGKRRRDACDFLGGDVIKKQLADGVSVRRVGLVSAGAPARQHSEILTPEGQKVGEVSSGAFSPCLKKNIAMGYVDKAYAKAGTPLKVVVRGRENEATVTKMPFVPNKYYKPA